MRNIKKSLWSSARRRADEKALPFNITPDDIVVPHSCPVLGIPLETGKGTIKDHSPTLDRIIPERGYVRGNIVVVSARANRLKSDASLDELARVARFYIQLLHMAGQE